MNHAPTALLTEIDDDATRRRFLQLIAVTGLLAACADDEDSGAAPEPTESSAPPCRDFAGDEGTVCVPRDARRIIAVNYFSYEILQALGIAAVAVTGVDDLPAYLGGGAEPLPNIGTFQEPNLEAIAALGPDLIIGNPNEEATTKLAGLAPYVGINTQVPETWQRATTRHAEALGVPEKAAALIADYEARVDALREAIGDPQSTQISLVSVLAGDGVGIIGEGRTAGALLQDIGFARPEGQRGIENFLFPSPEEFALLDGDLMLLNSFGPADEVADLRAELEDAPLYPTLDVVQEDNVEEVGPHWFFHGPIAARLMLDDLERRFAGAGGTASPSAGPSADPSADLSASPTATD